MLRAAHRFNKAGVILGIQLFNRGNDFGLKISRQGIADQDRAVRDQRRLPDNADLLHQIRVIHANQAVEGADAVAAIIVTDHGGPGHRTGKLTVQHAENILLVAAGEGHAGEEVIIFIIRGAAELLFKGVVRN